MKKILLLGSTGKIGKKVLQQLIEDNIYDLGVLVRNLSRREISRSNKILYFEGDILDSNSLQAPIEWADVVINCTGIVSFKNKDKKKLYDGNVLGLKNIVQRCAEFKKILIHTSSSGIYGCSRTPIYFSESRSYGQNTYLTNYFISKREAEDVVLQSNIQKIIFRPASIISKEHSTVKTFYGVFKKGFIPAFRGGASFVLVDDVATAYISILKKLDKGLPKNEYIYNLGGNNLSISEVFSFFKFYDNRKKRILTNRMLLLLSKLNDSVLLPLFGFSFITKENYNSGNNFNYVDSSKAQKDLSYSITPFDISLKELF